MGIKEMMMKKFINFKIVRNIPGQLVIRFDTNKNIESEFRKYETLVVIGGNLLDGIKDMQFDYSKNLIGVSYDIKKLEAKRVLAWIQIIIDTLVDNLKFIQNNWQNNSDEVIRKIEYELKKRI